MERTDKRESVTLLSAFLAIELTRSRLNVEVTILTAERAIGDRLIAGSTEGKTEELERL